jgi:hypothetical protein
VQLTPGKCAVVSFLGLIGKEINSVVMKICCDVLVWWHIFSKFIASYFLSQSLSKYLLSSTDVILKKYFLSKNVKWIGTWTLQKLVQPREEMREILDFPTFLEHIDLKYD